MCHVQNYNGPVTATLGVNNFNLSHHWPSLLSVRSGVVGLKTASICLVSAFDRQCVKAMKLNPEKLRLSLRIMMLGCILLSLSGGATNCQINTPVIKLPINTQEKHGKNVHTVNVNPTARQQLCRSQWDRRGYNGKIATFQLIEEELISAALSQKPELITQLTVWAWCLELMQRYQTIREETKEGSAS